MSVLTADLLNDKEYLVLVANLLISFGKAGLTAQTKYQGINYDDAGVIELCLNQDPSNVYLAAILQGHALIKWSDSVPLE